MEVMDFIPIIIVAIVLIGAFWLLLNLKRG